MTKEPWGPGTPWRNSVAWFTYLRGCLRKAWSRHPTRIAVVNKQRKQIDNPGKGHRKTVWGFDCSLCGGTFTIKDAQVDHIIPAGTLRQTSDIQGFVERLLYVTEDDLRLVCRGCNMTAAFAERKGISFELAMAEKKAIKMEKEKSLVAFLEQNATIPATTAKARRQQAIDILVEKNENK